MLKIKNLLLKNIPLNGTFAYFLKKAIYLSIDRKVFKGVCLDLGCGKGEVLKEYIKKRTFKNIDLVDKFVKPLEIMKDSSVKYYQNDIFDFLESQKINKYDLIVLSDILEHVNVQKTKDILERCNKVLSPGGILFIKVPNGTSPFGLRNQNNDLTHVHTWGYKTLNEVVDDSHFEVLILEPCFDNVNFTNSFMYLFQKNITQKLINKLLKISLGNNRFFWSPNICLIAKKTE